MIRKTLTVFSLIGLLLSVGLWGVSYWNVGVLVDRSSYYVMAQTHQGGLSIGVESFPSGNLGNGTTWGMGGFRGFQTSIVGPWITHYHGSTSIIIPLPLLAVCLGLIFMYCASPSHRRRKRKKLGLCVKCGYDLRASKDRCPECGTEFVKEL